MNNFKLKSFLGSIIVLIGLLLSACNGGSSSSGGVISPTPSPSPTPTSTPSPSPTPTSTPILRALSVTPLLESFSIESNGATYALISRSGSLSDQVTIALKNDSPSMSVDKTSVTLSENESSTYVKVNGVTIGNATLQATASGYNESSVEFSIEAAPLFSCVADISNPESPTLCGCLNQNDGSGLTWYSDASQTGAWINWCSGSGGAESDPECTTLNSSTQGNNGESLNAFNTKNHCGYSDWHLPTMTTPGEGNGVVESSGGNWGDIGTYAINSGTYTSGSDFGNWLTDNRFGGVYSYFYYFYWSSASYGDIDAWGMEMQYAYVTRFYGGTTKGVLVVRGRP